MSDKKRHLNPLLLLIAILLCLSAGFLFRRTSFDPNYKIPARHSSVIKKSKVTPTPVLTQKPKANVSISATPTITVEPSVSPSESISQDETSPEASLGVWTSSGSNWMFMVDGVPYTGWLIDTDGNHPVSFILSKYFTEAIHCIHIRSDHHIQSGSSHLPVPFSEPDPLRQGHQ